jgi:hypothetical protein
MPLLLAHPYALLHLQTDGSVANHPNMWYQTSVQYHKAKHGAVSVEDSGQPGGGEARTEEGKEVKMEKDKEGIEMDIVN